MPEDGAGLVHVSEDLRDHLGSVTADLSKELENIRNEMARMQHTLHHDLANLQVFYTHPPPSPPFATSRSIFPHSPLFNPLSPHTLLPSTALHHHLVNSQEKGMQDLKQLDSVRRRATGGGATGGGSPGVASVGGASSAYPSRAQHQASEESQSFFDAKFLGWVAVIVLLCGPFWPMVVQVSTCV
jgi:hypothetical protein